MYTPYVEKYVGLSNDLNTPIVLYDDTCELCKKAASFAIIKLKNHYGKAIKISIQKANNRDISKKDDFTLIIPGNNLPFFGHNAWIEIMSYDKRPISIIIKKMSRYMVFKQMCFVMYKIISKARKIFNFKKCNC